MCNFLEVPFWSLGVLFLCGIGCENGTPKKTVATRGLPAETTQDDGAEDTARVSSVPFVTPSARGWTISTQSRPDAAFDTIIQSPSRQRFNAGHTGVPDYHRPILWVLEPPGIKRKLLLIYLSPVASGPSTLSVYLIQDDHIVCKAAQIAHHFEWTKDTKLSRIIHQLFHDQDADGTPELIADEVGKFGGTVTFLEFNGKTFSPRWRETYKLNEHEKLTLS